jgi:hypothetical protein
MRPDFGRGAFLLERAPVPNRRCVRPEDAAEARLWDLSLSHCPILVFLLRGACSSLSVKSLFLLPIR